MNFNCGICGGSTPIGSAISGFTVHQYFCKHCRTVLERRRVGKEIHLYIKRAGEFRFTRWHNRPSAISAPLR